MFIKKDVFMRKECFFRTPKPFTISFYCWLQLIAILLLSALHVSKLHAVESSAPSVSEPIELAYDKATAVSQHLSIYLGDRHNDYDIERIRGLDSSAWEQNNYDNPALYYLDHPVWLTFEITTEQVKKAEWVLHIGSAKIEELEFYHVRDGQLIQRIITGDRFGYFDRPINFREYLLPIVIEPFSSSRVYLKLRAQRLSYPITITPRELFFFESQNREFLLVFFFGGLALLALYNLFLYLSIRDLAYAQYSLLILFNILTVASYEGHTFAFLWPESPQVHIYSQAICGKLMMAFTSLFCAYFLELKNLSRSLHYYCWFLASIFFALVFSDFTPYASEFRQFAAIMAILAHISFMAVGFYAWHKRMIYAKYFTLAWMPIALATGYTIYNTLHEAYTPLFMDSVLFSYVISALILSFALAYKISVLQKKTIAAESESRFKTLFLTNMSHEIRTPMNGVLGMSALLSDRLTDPVSRRYNDIIQECSRSLLSVINNILDLSKIEAGKMDFEILSFKPSSLVLESMAVFKLKALEQGVELVADIDPSLPQELLGDPTQLKQIITNLMGNALKFTSQGYVKLSIDRIKSEAATYRLMVTDTGEGIPASSQERLFTAFAQATSSITRLHGGTGLGLSICKRLAEQMEGAISFESEEGVGSRFWVTLPLVVEKDKLNQAPDDSRVAALKDCRVLIVEANPLVASLYKRQAKNWGMNATVVDNASAAIDTLARSYQEQAEFQLLLVAYNIANSGLTLIRTVEHDQRFSRVRCVYLAAVNNMPTVASIQCQCLGAVMERPVLASELLEGFYTALEGEQTGLASLQSDEAILPTQATLSVLVADDNLVNRMVASAFLTKLGHMVTTVNNGREALDYVVDHHDQIDLVLMDLQMPEMGGYEATKAIRDWEQLGDKRRLPIIALTAHALLEERERCLQEGMDGHLTKPVEKQALINVLAQFPSSNVGE